MKRFPYRARSYRKRGSDWLPGDPDKETRSYEARVQREPKELGAAYQKG